MTTVGILSCLPVIISRCFQMWLEYSSQASLTLIAEVSVCLLCLPIHSTGVCEHQVYGSLVGEVKEAK